MIRTLIIEDEPAIRKEIEWLLQQETQFNLIGYATSVAESLVLIKATNPELILMDIQLTDGTAFDILDQLNEIPFRIIFITAYNHFAVKAIKFGALDYLLKPLDDAEFKAALAKIATNDETNITQQKQQISILKSQSGYGESNLDSRIVLHTLEFLQVLQLREIIYCQSEGGYTNFFLTEGRRIMISKPLKFYDELLPEKWFLRPHQSYLVNVLYVDKFLKSGTIVLKDKTEIPVSGRRKDYILQHINHIE
ncbi:two-component system response regulator [Pedobacter sp. Leaf41]|jgi:two-component system LytT family response regulator|uniref:LytR/AlgR family response regulator transcription factor n=1 Tax=Pedobacter sp. Leaf41 TaxID=1736218 RepID=UPI0007034345|nr:LytTR family DNA-binding domain-containing protein [Pedobacter sp. Leaf41]KQN34361.1 two-component system response regulator [Pedobacter sp. Leaf41]RZL66709.1 MAG: response regulator transcription factor [Pedobacter sp.]